MTTSTLYFFVDTNLFIQCRRLEDLDWSPWYTFEEVRLIVSDPVLRELDGLKKRGGRAGKRARAAQTTFRNMLGQTYKTVHADSPQVVLSVEPKHKPDPNLKEYLNYQERDDQLIGTALAFAGSNPSNDVRLLTLDTTPLYTAQGLGLTVNKIPDEWLLPDEATEAERKAAALEAENARLKSTEPSVLVRCEDPTGTDVDCYRVSYTRCKPLTEAEVNHLMEKLRDRFPIAIDFMPPPPIMDNGLLGALGPPVAIKPTEEEQRKYWEDDYPRWESLCEDTLRFHHKTLQAAFPLPKFAFLAGNSGTRPADDVLITVEARGGFTIRPPPLVAEDEGQPRMLFPPPVAPVGHWSRSLGDAVRIGAMTQSWMNLQHDFHERKKAPALRPFTFNPGAPLDSNSFHYKRHRPTQPRTSFALECKRWRHGGKEKRFIGEIHVPTDQEAVKGLLVCRIEAANLSSPVSCCIPVRIAITHVSSFDSASQMVDSLVGNQRPAS